MTDPAARLWTEHPTGRFVARTLAGRHSAGRGAYAAWVPATWGGAGRLPVILALHGSGERGRDGEGPTTLGLGPVLRADVALQLTAPVTHPGATPADVGERSGPVPIRLARRAAAELGRQAALDLDA
jgi:hypothetical protein